MSAYMAVAFFTTAKENSRNDALPLTLLFNSKVEATVKCAISEAYRRVSGARIRFLFLLL